MLAQALVALTLAMAPTPLPATEWEVQKMAKAPYKMSARGRAWLRDAEGCKLKAYADSRGIPTIGVGHTGQLRGQALTLGMTATLAECDALLAEDLQWAEAAVAQAAAQRATQPTQPQIDALVAFAFNAGAAGFAKSEVRRDFVFGNDHEVPHDLFQWTRAGADAEHLASRRSREALMYSRGFYLSNGWETIP
jgi:lysozyme